MTVRYCYYYYYCLPRPRPGMLARAHTQYALMFHPGVLRSNKSSPAHTFLVIPVLCQLPGRRPRTLGASAQPPPH